MHAVNTCHSESELKAWCLGQLDDDVSEAIAEHLTTCPRCEETVSSFDDTSDSLVQDLRSDGSDGPPEIRPENESAQLQQSLDRVRNPWVSRTAPPEHPADHLLAREFLRDYELLESIGTGGMGTVYRAIHRRLQRTVALKLLPARRLRDQTAVGRFEREMQAIGRLDHPAIVRATDAGEVDGTHFLAMDFVDGIDLSRMVRLTGPLPVADACEVVRQAALGLQYAHEQNLIHRDVKPSNLMIDPRPVAGRHHPELSESAAVRILDLGLALFGSASEAVDELTTVGQLMGTLDYMAPEQADNSHAVDARADIYSLGATLFKLLTGAAPYESSALRSPLQKMKAIATQDPPPVRMLCDSIPEAVATIVDRMLQRNPENRFPSANDVAVALQPFCQNHQLGSTTRAAVARLEREKLQKLSAVSLCESPPSLPCRTRGGNQDMQREHDALPEAEPGQRAHRGRWLRPLTAVLSCALVILAGLTIWVRTNKGTLKIETELEDAEIEVRQSGRTVDNFSIAAAGNELTLYSGDYEVVVREPHDGVIITDDTFTLTRGQTHIIRITRDENAAVAGTEAESFPDPGSSPRVSPTTDSAALLDLQPELVSALPDPIDRIHFLHSMQRYADLLREKDRLLREQDDMAATHSSQHPSLRRTREQQALVESRLEELRQQLREFTRMAEASMAEKDFMEERRKRSEEREQTAADEPTYENHNFDYWQSILANERSPAELERAVMALCILSRGKREAEAAASVMSVIRPYPCMVGRDSPESQLVTTAIRYLRGLPPEPVTATLVNELDRGIGYGRDHVFDGLLNSTLGTRGFGEEGPEVGSASALIAHAKQDESFVAALLRSFSALGEQQQIRAIQFLPEMGGMPDADAALQPVLRQLLTSDDLNLRVFAAENLVSVDPGQHLVPPLLQSVKIDGADPNSLLLSQTQLRIWRALWELREFLQPDLETLITLPRGQRTQKSGYPRLGGSSRSQTQRPVAPFVTFRDETTIPVLLAGDAVRYAVPLSKRLLQIEVIGGVGADTPAVRQLLAEEFRHLTGQMPSASGEYVYRSTRDTFLIEQNLDLESAGSPTLYDLAPDSRTPRESGEVERLKSLLLTFRRVTGSDARFDMPLTGRNGNALWTPTQSAFRERSFDDWLAVGSLDEFSQAELASVSQGLRLLAQDDPQQQRALPVMLDVLRQLIGRSAMQLSNAGQSEFREALMQETGTPLHETLQWCHNIDSDVTAQQIVDAFDSGTRDEQTLILLAIAAPSSRIPDTNILRPVYTDFAERLHEDAGATKRFEKIHRQWDELPATLQQAVLFAELAAPTVQNAPTLPLLRELLQMPESPSAFSAALALSYKVDLPEELKPAVTKCLVASLSSGHIDTNLVNATAALGRLWTNELPPEVSQALLTLLQEDLAKDKPAALTVVCRRAGHRNFYELILSRRILLAELLQARCGSDTDLKEALLAVLTPHANPGAEVPAGVAEVRIFRILLEATVTQDSAEQHEAPAQRRIALFIDGSAASGVTEDRVFQYVAEGALRTLRQPHE